MLPPHQAWGRLPRPLPFCGGLARSWHSHRDPTNHRPPALRWQCRGCTHGSQQEQWGHPLRAGLSSPPPAHSPSPGRLKHPAPSFFLDRGALVRRSGEAPGTWGETLPSLANMSGCRWALPGASEVFQAHPSPSTTCPGAPGEAGEVPQAADTPSAPGGWLRAGCDCPVPGARPSGRCSPATGALSPGPPARGWPEGFGHARARWPGQEHGTG